MASLKWPVGWQEEAIAAATPHVDADARLDIWIGPPEHSVSGTRLSGYLYSGRDGEVMVIHDHSGRADVHAWRLLRGPVLLIKLLRPRRPGVELYRHPNWPKSAGRP